MITTIWYSVNDKLPTVQGHYMAYKLPTYGDDSEGVGVHYYRFGFNWPDWHETMAVHSSIIQVSFWAYLPNIDSDTPNTKGVPTPAELTAWRNVEDAISKYNMIRALVA